MIGEDALLSGGERQRVSIARAVLLDPPVLVLDEATAAADAGNEVAIQDALSRFAQGRTLLVIAHRLDTVMHADRILVLDGGVIAEHGTHAQLLAQQAATRASGPWAATKRPRISRNSHAENLPATAGRRRAVFRRYAWMAVAHGLLCGLTITALAPLLAAAGRRPGRRRALAGRAAGRRDRLLGLAPPVEQAGVRVGTTVLQTARHRLGDHVASLPVGWFTPQNTARLSHIVTQGTMAVAQLPAHVFTPVIGGLVTPFVIVGALFALHWQLGLIALAALPLLAGVLFLTGRLARRADGAFHERYAGASQRMVEFSQAQSVLRAFNGEGGGMRFLSRRWTGNGNRRRG